MSDRCIHLREILGVQKDIALRHVDKHMWFRHIPDKNEALADFIASFGELMRELYCGFSCNDRLICTIAQNFLPSPPSLTDSIFSDNLEWARQELIKKHLDKHKWYNHILDNQQAKQDFLQKFDWIIKEIICLHTCQIRHSCSEAREFLLMLQNKA